MNAHGRNAGFVMGSLLASTATLLCCVLPAVMVSIGAGAALMALVSSFPQLVWLSEHKGMGIRPGRLVAAVQRRIDLARPLSAMPRGPGRGAALRDTPAGQFRFLCASHCWRSGQAHPSLT